MATNAQRQMWALESLQITPDDSYEMTRFSVEEAAGGTLYVIRAYSPRHAPSLRYFECFSVGPRGAIKCRGKNFSY